MSTPSQVQSPEPQQPLGTFGKYRLIRRLASGGMAQLYLANIDGPGGFSKTVAVKRILPRLADRPDFNEMFTNEARVAGLLNHPNIVQVFDFGRVGDQYYLAMEYVEGCSLDALMRAAAKTGLELGPRLAVHLGIPLCDALAYVQSLRLPSGELLHLVHRDIAPGNILISNSAEVKLADFGIAKTTINPKSTAAGVLKGKFAYMSPEQARGDVLDGRSDLFSLGVVLYEVATGHRLWKRASVLEMLAAVARAEVPRPTALVPGFPPDVERILLKALARDPDDRYQTAAELMADLDAYRVSQRWTLSGRRELATVLAGAFPDWAPFPSDVSAVHRARKAAGSSPGDSSPSASSGSGSQTVAPPRPPPDEMSSVSAELVDAADAEDGSLPGVELEAAAAGVSGREVSLLVGTAVVATAAFWWFVLS